MEVNPKGETGQGGIKLNGEDKKEVDVVTWNVRTLAVKGNNDLSHAETLLLRAQKSRCDIHRIAGGKTGRTKVVRGSWLNCLFQWFGEGWEIRGRTGCGEAHRGNKRDLYSGTHERTSAQSEVEPHEKV